MKKLQAFLFENQTIWQTVAKNTFWLGFGQIASRLIKAVLIIYAARILGAEGFGIFSYALSLIAFFTIFTDIGISSVLTREATKKPELLTHYLSTAFFTKLTLAILSILLVIFIAPLFTRIPDVLPLLPIAGLILVFDSFREFTFAITRAKEKMQIEAGINIVTNSAITLLGLTALLITPQAKTLVIGYALGSGVGTAAAFWVLKEHFKSIWSFFSKTVLRQILSEAWPLAIFGLLGGIMINTDMLMLGWIKTVREVGFYSAAQRPVQLFYALPAILSVSLFPTFSRLAHKDNKGFRLIFEKTMKVIFLLALPIVAGGMLLAPDIIQLFFGGEYLPATLAFRLLLLTIFSIFPGSFLGYAIFAYKQQKSLISFVALGTLVNVLLNYSLIPTYGIIGAALATIVAQLLVHGLAWYKLKTINDFAILPHLPKIIIAATVMTLFVGGLKIVGAHVIANVVLGGIFYFMILAVLKEPLLPAIRAILKSA